MRIKSTALFPVFALVLAGCLTSTQEPTKTLGPTQTDEDFSQSRIASETIAPSETPFIEPTVSPTALNTRTSIPLATTTPFPTIVFESPPAVTAAPISQEDAFLQGLIEKGFLPIPDFQGSFIGPGGFVYSIYGFTDPSLDPIHSGDVTSPEVCRMAVYRSDGVSNELIRSFGAPTFPESSRYAGYPVQCGLVNWNVYTLGGLDPFTLAHISDETRDRVDAIQYSIDINQNGLPEFAVASWYCPNACDGNEISIDFYEIQNTSKVINLTDSIPGAILPLDIFYSVDPITIKVWDVGLEYFPHLEFAAWWIYQWNGQEFTDVSTNYAQDYIAFASPLIDRIKAQQGAPFSDQAEIDILRFLFPMDKAGHRQEAIQLFQELSDLKNWPGTNLVYQCWLQYVEASLLEDYRLNRSFRLPIPVQGPIDWNVQRFLDDTDESRYDLTACKEFLDSRKN